MFRRAVFVGLIAVSALVLSALAFLICQGRQAPRTSGQYVALGSSFAAGIGLGPREPGSPLVCMRSTGGYPQRLARMSGLSLVDMTCSGSTTEHILRGGQLFLGPQIAAIGPATRWVTVTSGGNDVGYIGDLVLAGSGAGRLLARLGKKGPKPLAERDFGRVEANLAEIVAEVRRRAPDAKVVIVSYPPVLPPRGTCAMLGVDAKTADLSRDVASRLRRVTQDAAEGSGALFVDMATLGAGHDACSDTPWINGARPRTGTPFHPNAAGANATAAAVFEVVFGRPAPV
jgi:lysophospholipase L1-like esterase